MTQSSKTDVEKAESGRSSDAAEAVYEKWKHWSVNWTAVWIGALAAFAMVLLFGLLGTAIGAHVWGAGHEFVDLKTAKIEVIALCVCGAFFSFVVGGWVSAKTAGVLHSEPGILYGAVSWLVAVPMILFAAELGASRHLGGWYGGLAGSTSSSMAEATPFARPDPLLPEPTREEVAAYRAQSLEYAQNVKKWREDAPRVARNSSLGALAALLLGLVGAVIGGWKAADEPMTFTHHLTRTPRYSPA